MSESMDSTIRALYDAFNRRDWTVISEIVSPDVVIEETPGASPEARAYRGWDGTRAYLDGMFKFWAQVTSRCVGSSGPTSLGTPSRSAPR